MFGTLGGEPFDDAPDKSLTLNDRLVSINASWSYDTLVSLVFTYSNGATSQHGTGDLKRRPSSSALFQLKNGENFNNIVIYRDIRDIENPFAPNGTMLIVGIQFFTDQARQSDMFGSLNGTSISESFPNYELAYIQGRSLGFIDALQFTWIRRKEQDASMMIIPNI